MISTFSPTNPLNILGKGLAKSIEWIYKTARPVFPRGVTNFGDISKYSA